jgi:endonuclease YncB( thermonuclease family)
MKKLLRKIDPVFFVVALILCSPWTSWAQVFRVIEVYDGDTIRVTGEDIELLVRLVGVDAPEIWKDVRYAGQPFGREAQAYLASLILNKEVGITGYGYMDNKILLGEIFFEGENINLKMLEAGLAEIPPEGSLPEELDSNPYIEAEGRAKTAPEGIWTLGQDYVSPTKWRENHRSKSAAALILYGILKEGAK